MLYKSSMSAGSSSPRLKVFSIQEKSAIVILLCLTPGKWHYVTKWTVVWRWVYFCSVNTVYSFSCLRGLVTQTVYCCFCVCVWLLRPIKIPFNVFWMRYTQLKCCCCFGIALERTHTCTTFVSRQNSQNGLVILKCQPNGTVSAHSTRIVFALKCNLLTPGLPMDKPLSRAIRLWRWKSGVCFCENSSL